MTFKSNGTRAKEQWLIQGCKVSPNLAKEITIWFDKSFTDYEMSNASKGKYAGINSSS